MSSKRVPQCEATDLASIQRHGLLDAIRRAAAIDAGVVALAFPSWSAFVVNDPECIAQVLAHDAASYGKPDTDEWRELMGDGLITVNGPRWQRARARAQAAFGRSLPDRLWPIVRRCTDERSERWRTGGTLDCVEEMRALALRLAVESLFGVPISWSAEHMADALKVVMTYSYSRLSASQREQRPAPERGRFEQAVSTLHGIAEQIIDAALGAAPSDEPKNLLQTLLSAEDEAGARLTRRELRDEVVTFLIAGSESTAVSLGCALWLLAGAPAARQRLAQEVRKALGDDRHAMPDLARLPYLRAVYTETLRLYPPAWAVARVALRPVELDGHSFRAGSVFFCSAYTVQRDARWYPEPEAFRPERWLDGGASQLPRMAYFPFGGGKRLCIGQHQALLEAAFVSCRLAQRWDFERDAGEALMYAGVNLHPVTPLLVRALARAEASAPPQPPSVSC